MLREVGEETRPFRCFGQDTDQIFLAEPPLEAGGLGGQIGGIERAEEQRGIDEAMARHEFAQMEPFNRATMGMQALMSPGQAFGRSTSESQTTSSPSTFSNIGNVLGAVGGLGGGLLGAGGMLGGMMGGGNPFRATPVNPYSGGAGMYNNPWTMMARV